MITQERIKEWQQQSSKDLQQYKKDQLKLKQQEKFQNRQVRSFFERMRARFFKFQNSEFEKLGRLLTYTEIIDDLQHYPKILNAYITYNVSSILLIAACVLAPRKIYIVYGLKVNVFDGLFTYHLVQNLAMGGRMTAKEQELRNVLEFYHMQKKFNETAITQQQIKETDELLGKLKVLDEQYTRFKAVQNLL